jgi:RecA-family ATPase
MGSRTVRELLAWKPPPVIPIVGGGLILPESKVFIYGRYKSWKSMIAMHTAFCIATGKPWFGFKTTATTTLLLQTEITDVNYRTRVDKYVNGNSGVDIDNLHIWHEPYIKVDKGFGYTQLENEIMKVKPGVVILDPLFEIVSGRLTDEFDMRQFTDRMNILVAKYHFALVLIHHDRKDQIFEGQVVNTGSQSMYGTVYFLGWCDTAIRIESREEYAKLRLVPDVIRNAESEVMPFTVKVDSDTLRFNLLQEE